MTEVPERRDRPRLGPYLRRYGQDQVSTRQRTTELALGGVAGIGFLVLVIGVIWLFLRYPFEVLSALVGVWAVGYVLLTVLSRRAVARERDLRKGRTFEELRRRSRVDE